MSKRTAFDDDGDSPRRKRGGRSRCNYCFREKPLVPLKNYCFDCIESGVECNLCHRPLRHNLIVNGICNACNRKRQHVQVGLGRNALVVALPLSNPSDPLTSLVDARSDTRNEVTHALTEHNGIKWHLTMIVLLTKLNRLAEEIDIEATFSGELVTLLLEGDFDEQFDDQVDIILKRLNEFVRNGSGWTVERVVNLSVRIAAYKPTSGSNYIKSPKYIVNKHSVLNIVNKDEKCFIWSVLASIYYPKSHQERVSKYRKFENKLNTTGLKFPLSIHHVKKFENLNPNISVNVFAYDGKTGVYPIYVTTFKDRRHHANLLLLSDGQKNHYTLITNMSGLLNQPGGHGHAKHFCNYCLHGFRDMSTLLQHTEDCIKFGPQKVVLPNENECWVKFKATQKMLKVPFVIYADFESYTEKMPADSNYMKSTTPYEKHVASGFAYLVVCSEPSRIYEPVVYRGESVVEEFLKRLKEESDKICDELKQVKPMKLTPEEELAFQTADTCYLCGKPTGDDKVRDHEHAFNGKYRGCAHSACNLQLRYRGNKAASNFYIPVIFHNLRGYDGHLILKSFKREIFKKGDISCIPNNMERYLSFTIDNLRFIDSLQFMNESLEKLCKNLRRDDFVHTLRHSPPDKYDMLIRKGVFCYDYWDGPQKADETNLPPREAFYSRLTEEHITEEDYQHAQKVWTSFELKTLGEYHDLYLKTDVLVLSDVFENFRTTCMKNYELDAAHYFSSPGLAWDAMLKMTGVELELMQEREMHDIIDKGIRGGICNISHKHAVANNIYIPETYNKNLPSSFILYLDMNNLYGTAMSEPLPEREFTFLSSEQVENFDFMNVPDDGPMGFILEVDIDYPHELHDSHSDYPLCCEAMSVQPEELSPYTRSLGEKLKINPTNNRKLICNLKRKEKYAVHCRNLKLYVSLGMKVTKIHRIISFKQSRWLKKYIDFNTEQRKRANNEFEKNFFKLMNNAVFGKTLESLRKHQDVKLVSEGRKFKKLVAKPNFKSFKIFSEDLVGVHLGKTEIKLIKPTYVGFSILDLSKTFMYDFYYNKMVKRYGSSVKLLMTDTDSFIIHVQTPDVYRDMAEDIDAYDTSDYPQNHFAYSVKNKKVLGKMKDELNGRPVQEFVGLRPKMYSLLEADGHEKKTAKGISKRVTDRLRHEEYRQALYSENSTTVTMQQIRSMKHDLFTVSLKKRV